MKAGLLRLVVLASVAGALVACDADPVALAVDATEPAGAGLELASGADRIVHRGIYDFVDTQLVMPCDADGNLVDDSSELLRLEGRLVVHTTFMETPNGGVHITWNRHSVDLRGYSSLTGEEFRVHDVGRGGVHAAMGSTGGFRDELVIHGAMSHRRLTMVFSARYAQNANGEYVVDRYLEKVECRI